MKNTTTRIECSGCDRFFATNGAFVEHRVGNMAKGEVRRCMTDEEMTGHGYATEQKYVSIPIDGRPDWHEKSVWFDVAGREAMRERFSDRWETLPDIILDVL